MLQPSTVYLNGQFISNDRASISTDDRGFYFGDGVYEVIKFYKKNPFYYDAHMIRLKNSLNELKILYTEIAKLRSVCDALIEINHYKNAYAGVYIQITRGAAPRSHRFPADDIKPTVFAKAFALPAYLKEMALGVEILSREDIRWLKCHVKSISLLPNTLLFEEVAAKGAFECMLVRNGNITEASHSNLFAVRNGIVYTHPDGNLILPGVTKMAVLDICRSEKIQVIEEPVRQEEMYNFDEWFLTGTGSEIIPVIRIDGKIIGDGNPGKVTRKIQQAFFGVTYETLAGEKLVLNF